MTDRDTVTPSSASKVVTNTNDSSAALPTLSEYFGVKLPSMPQTLRNLDKAVATLIDWPTAYVEGQAARIRSATQREVGMLAALTEAEATALADATPSISGPVRGAVRDFIKRQRGRERILQLTLEEMASDSNAADPSREITEDFLAFFAGKIDYLGTDQARHYFAKVLAGELKRPGSFSKQALNILHEMDDETGRLFETACNMSADTHPSPSGTPRIYTIGMNAGQNDLAAFGLGFLDLIRLTDTGLISSDINAQTNFVSPVAIAGKIFVLRFELQLNEDLETARKRGDEWIAARKSAILFTRAGAQLRQIVSMKPNDEYIAKLAMGVAQAGLELTPQ